MLGAAFYDRLRSSHRAWVEEYLGDGIKDRQDEWTGSIAVGSRPFIENVKELLAFKARGEREVRSGGGGYCISSERARLSIRLLSGPKKEDIDPENTYLWDFKIE